MRRRILTIFLAAVVLALVVPLGAALTLDRRLPLATSTAASIAPQVPGTVRLSEESVGLALTGTVFIGLAFAVRRAR
jgi:hypothetical protein